jgi:hypothetical protein
MNWCKLASLLVFMVSMPANAISFTQETAPGGNVSTSNLPSFCVLDGVLVCHRNSSLFVNGEMSNSLQPRDKSRQGKPQNSRPIF